MRSRISRILIIAGIAVTIAGLLGIILLSPLALSAYDRAGKVDWNQLSLIGQTYGPISALIGGIALIGVGASLALQTREARESRLQDQRSRHADLLRDAINDPELAACWGPVGLPDDDFTALKHHLYTNQIVSTWQTSYKIGVISEGQLARSATTLFSGPIGRSFWERTRSYREGQARDEDGTAMRFHTILEAAYQNAPAPAKPAQARTREQERSRSREIKAATFAGFFIIAVTLVRSRNRARCPSQPSRAAGGASATENRVSRLPHSK
jgi:hypothetical protein